MPRTYLYKLTSDRGGAPCAPPPRAGARPLLTLSICKPAIRRTAEPGDRLLGVTSRALTLGEGYPADAVIYAAVVTKAVDAREYYAKHSVFRSRPDCIYAFHRQTGMLSHAGRSPLHAEPAYRVSDIGQYPFYRNARMLLSEDFRYFGRHAVALVDAGTWRLEQTVQTLGQGHRVFADGHPEMLELNALFGSLWKLPSGNTPRIVTQEARGHVPRAS